MVASAIFHVVIPLGLAAWMGVSTPGSRVHLLAKTALAISLTGVLWTGDSGWHIVGTVLRPFVAGAVLVGTAASLRWWTSLPWWPASIWPAGIATVAWTVLGAGLAYSWGLVLAGASPPDGERVDLEFPLREGRFYVAWGGSHPAMNRHLSILESEKRDEYRGQAYAQDIVEVDAFGRRADGLLPTDLESYDIFGARVVAPCAGRVARAVGDRPDVSSPEPDDGPPAGNHVLLACGDDQVLLAHLKQESLFTASRALRHPGLTPAARDSVGRLWVCGTFATPGARDGGMHTSWKSSNSCMIDRGEPRTWAGEGSARTKAQLRIVAVRSMVRLSPSKTRWHVFDVLRELRGSPGMSTPSLCLMRGVGLL
jgi:hypothetical protein